MIEHVSDLFLKYHKHCVYETFKSNIVILTKNKSDLKISLFIITQEIFTFTKESVSYLNSIEKILILYAE